MAEKKIAIITNVDALGKAIASIANRGAKLDHDIQVAAVSVLANAEHGNPVLADRLVQAMPKGSRRNALVQYLLTFGRLEVVGKDVAKATGRVFQFAKDKKYDPEGAMATMWYDFKKEADIQTVFAVDKGVQALLDKLTKAKAAGKTIEGQAAALATAKALVAALEGAAE